MVDLKSAAILIGTPHIFRRKFPEFENKKGLAILGPMQQTLWLKRGEAVK